MDFLARALALRSGGTTGGTSGGVATVADRTALAAVASPGVGSFARMLVEAGRAGLWVAVAESAWTSVIAADTAKGLVVQSTADATKAWVRVDSDRGANARWFGVVADNVTNDAPAIVAALAALKAAAANDSGGTYKGSMRLRLPAGSIYMGSTTLDVTHTLIIEGEGSGQSGGVATNLRWASGTVGLRFQRYNTSGNRVVGATHHGADGAIVRGLRLEGGSSASGNTALHAFDTNCRVTFEDCIAYDWGGNGFNVVASAGGGNGLEGNANCFSIERCASFFCLNGLYITGADANAGMVTRFDATANRLWGIDDSSFLGNHFSACHAASNGTGALGGAYRSTNANATGCFDDCYAEGGQNISTFAPATLTVAGQQGADVTGGTYFKMGTSYFAIRPTSDVLYVQSTISGNVYLQVSGTGGYGTLQLGVGTAGQIQGSPGYLYLNAATGSVIRNGIDGAAIFDVTTGGIELATGKVLRVGGTPVVGAQRTGWTAATGTPARGAFAAAAAGAASAAYVQAELQSALNRIAALEARFIALEADARAHGLIN